MQSVRFLQRWPFIFQPSQCSADFLLVSRNDNRAGGTIMPNLKLVLLPKRESEAQTIEHLQNRIYELEEQLGARTEFPPMLGLTLSEEALLGVIFKREIVTQAAAFAVLYGSDADGGPSDPRNVVSVLIMRLRKKIAAHGIEIKTRNGVGYYMTTEAKNRLQRIMETAAGNPRPTLAP
jgi:DNA-binding response OmpR family regulator